MSSTVLRSAALAAGLAAGLAGAAGAQTNEERLRAAFAAADVNGDGVVDVDEYVGYFVRGFRARDTGNRGYLTMSSLDNPDPARFRQADRDGDGRISLGEAVADRMIVFFEIASDDGTISLDDLLAYEKSR